MSAVSSIISCQNSNWLSTCLFPSRITDLKRHPITFPPFFCYLSSWLVASIYCNSFLFSRDNNFFIIQDLFVGGNLTETDNSNSNSNSESSLESAVQVQSFQTMKKDLLLVILFTHDLWTPFQKPHLDTDQVLVPLGPLTSPCLCS